jgi:peptidoglycan/xylan/chitin deacetylase (PgdA/CDA1 family)
MILLSFDIEEFDMPLEYGVAIPFEEQMAVSVEGTERLLAVLEKQGVLATFYTTARFAESAPDLIKRMVAQGHEIASHDYYHSEHHDRHLAESKAVLDRISGTTIKGFRMPRLQPVSNEALVAAGYQYNSSMNPTYLPGRYNHFTKPRTLFSEGGLWQLPASVTPWVRFPLFWISFHNLPVKLYQWLAQWTLKNDGYLNTYFHPWEFVALEAKKYNFPGYVCKNTGVAMADRLEQFIVWGKKKGHSFARTDHFIAEKTKSK